MRKLLLMLVASVFSLTALFGVPLKTTNVYDIAYPTYRVPLPYPAASFTATPVGMEQVTLKVTATKGYVFAGWHKDEEFKEACDSTLADYRNPTYTYNVDSNKVNFNAHFVAGEEDTKLDLTPKTIQPKGNDQRAIQLVIDSYSFPKVSVTGLPTGMKFTATPVMVKGSKTEVEYPANTIYGTPTKPGIYTVKVALTNTTITKAITKTFNIEVPNLKAPGVIDVYDCYGEYVPGVSYIEEVPEAEGCTVTGLPAGMKWTAKDIVDFKTKEVTVPANSVYGVPTTPGNYTVYFTKTVDKVKYTATATFAVGPYPQLTVEVPVCTDGTIGGKVTGAGGFAANKKVTLKATPNKGYVFAGWYKDSKFDAPCDSTLMDYRNPSYTYVMGATNKTFYARFVPAEEDHLLTLTVKGKEITDGSRTFMVDGPSVLTFDVGSNSLPKVSATGLPAGMKFTATPVMVKGSKTEVDYPANTIYGTPTKPGIYTVKVALTNTTITKAITKTFNIEVPNLKALGVIDVYDYYGEYVPGVSYVEEVPEAEGCTVTGLPAGMKWTAKDIVDLKTKEVTVPANSVYGVPTTPGNYTVYFTKTVDKVKYTATATFKVGPYPQLNVMVSDDGVGGKVTGMGGFAANKTATLRATPNKDYVFAGWYEDEFFTMPCDSTLVDYRNPSYTYVMGTTDKTFYARFVTKKEDNRLELMVNDEEIWNETGFGDILTFVVFGESEFNFTLGSESLPKATVTGLPTGMKFTATTVMVKGSKTEVEYPANTIYGMPTKPGIYTVKVALTNTTVTKAITKTFNIEVPNLKAANEYFESGLKNDVGESYKVVIGSGDLSDLPSLLLTDSSKKLVVSGLPAGLMYDVKAGQIVGIPTKAGVYTVTLTVTEGTTKSISTITVEVEALPEWVQGTFEGDWYEYGWYDWYFYINDYSPNYEQLGRFTMTVSNTGKASIKMTLADTSDSVAVTAQFVEKVDEGTYRFVGESKAIDYKGPITFTIERSEYDGTSRGVITDFELYGLNPENEMPFVIEAEAWEDVWSNTSVSLPTIEKTETFTCYFEEYEGAIFGDLALEFKANSSKVTSSFIFDVEIEDYDGEPLYDPSDNRTMTKCTSQIVITDYDAEQGLYSAIVPLYMMHNDDGDWYDLGFIVPLTINKDGDVEVDWDSVISTHDDWYF